MYMNHNAYYTITTQVYVPVRNTVSIQGLRQKEAGLLHLCVAMFSQIRHITSANNHPKIEQYPYVPQPGKTKLKCLLTVGVRCFVTYLTYTFPEPPLKTNKIQDCMV